MCLSCGVAALPTSYNVKGIYVFVGRLGGPTDELDYLATFIGRGWLSALKRSGGRIFLAGLVVPAGENILVILNLVGRHGYPPYKS